jgi:hypothetical protein
VAHDFPLDVPAFGDISKEEAGRRGSAALAELRERGLVGGEPARLTHEGGRVYDSYLAARTAALRTLVDDWEPDRNPEIDAIIRRLAEALEAGARDD